MNQKIKIILCILLCCLVKVAYPQLNQITAAEYFWDVDPGAGNATPLAAASGSFTKSIETALLNTTSLPATGNHVFNVRFKDAYNHWSPLYKTVIVLLPSINTLRAIKVTAAEYFWDSDPGAGNATPMVAFDGAFDESIEEVLKNNVSIPVAVGDHVFNVRVKDAANNWSSTFKTVIEIQANISTIRNIKVTAAEYFWDADPGTGNATPMIAFDGAFNQSIEEVLKNNVPIPGAVGVHVFNVRVKDAANNWSSTFKTVIDIQANISTIRTIKVTAAEYFWDSDPGIGNATPMIAFDGAFNESIEEVLKNNVSIPTFVGIHVLNIRVKDAANNWSTTFKTIIDIESNISTVRQIKVTAGEYFWDTDPGAGNATALVAFDGNFNSSFEQIIGGTIPSPIAQGIHVLYTRARDASNNWGPKFGIVVNMDTSINAINVQINGTTSLCQNDLNGVIYTTALNGTNTYNWLINGGVITNGQGTNTVTVNWNATGPYELKLIECSAVPLLCDSDIISLNVLPVPTSNAAATICQGQSILLGGALQTQAGIYNDTFTATNGCDSIVSTTLTVNPIYAITNNVSICQGDSFYVAGQFQTTSGTYIDFLSTTFNCDSIVTTNLTVGAASNYLTNASICNGDSTMFNGSYYSQAGTYSITYQTTSGCDSVLTLQLTLNPNYVTTNNVSITVGDSLFVGGNWQLSTGTYYDSLLTVNGCDSIIITNLNVITAVNNISPTDVSLVYPNPFDDVIYIRLENIQSRTIAIAIFNLEGKMVSSFENILPKDLIEFKPIGLIAGAYMLRITAGNQIYKTILLKE